MESRKVKQYLAIVKSFNTTAISSGIARKMADGGAESIKRITEFILEQIERNKASHSDSVLVIGIQGPQGCGRSLQP